MLNRAAIGFTTSYRFDFYRRHWGRLIFYPTSQVQLSLLARILPIYSSLLLHNSGNQPHPGKSTLGWNGKKKRELNWSNVANIAYACNIGNYLTKWQILLHPSIRWPFGGTFFLLFLFSNFRLPKKRLDLPASSQSGFCWLFLEIRTLIWHSCKWVQDKCISWHSFSIGLILFSYYFPSSFQSYAQFVKRKKKGTWCKSAVMGIYGKTRMFM